MTLHSTSLLQNIGRSVCSPQNALLLWKGEVRPRPEPLPSLKPVFAFFFWPLQALVQSTSYGTEYLPPGTVRRRPTARHRESCKPNDQTVRMPCGTNLKLVLRHLGKPTLWPESASELYRPPLVGEVSANFCE
jgi:hypothetical protein